MVSSFCDSSHTHLEVRCRPAVGGDPEFHEYSRFPDSWEHLYQGDISSLEVRVLDRRDIDVFTHVRCLRHDTCFCGWDDCHIDSLIVAVDGACPFNGQAGANRSACGIYFGPNNAFNMSFLVPDEYRRNREGRRVRRAHTNQRAELRAVAEGLKAAQRFCQRGWRHHPFRYRGNPCVVRHIVIKSDSAYIVDAIAGRNGQPGWISHWVNNNFHRANGEPVKNRYLWDWILSETTELSSMGVTVEFWHVPRSHNREADALANEALRGNAYR
ncbi:putative ribonuclease h protein [Colletotrichum karsti]|uniref:ribonuclease H n=1 Tax=Colletotrichum karsti TaxID=1095194 RepID=A0A9P6LK52_9PEZI|nr:putative ribonuclease h protein [Colletotrichum karsti]KAF9876373.1 putative ribonuclease h protein [Colletotrichum karsti]